MVWIVPWELQYVVWVVDSVDNSNWAVTTRQGIGTRVFIKGILADIYLSRFLEPTTDKQIGWRGCMHMFVPCSDGSPRFLF